jgi:hypothetical protein
MPEQTAAHVSTLRISFFLVVPVDQLYDFAHAFP